MKHINIAIIALSIFAAPIVISAATLSNISTDVSSEVANPQDKNAEESAKDVLKEWKRINESLTKKTRKLFNDGGEAMSLNGVTFKQFNDWETLCSNIETDINEMIKTQGATDLKLNLKKWKSEKNTILKVLKSTNVDKSDADFQAWRNKYDAMTNAYNGLLLYYSDRAKDDNSENDSNTDAVPVDAKQTNNVVYSDPWAAEKDELKKQNDILKATNDSLRNALTEVTRKRAKFDKAFDVCVLLPLAIKYDADYVSAGYEAAEEMINSNSISNPDMITDWEQYKGLMTNYGLYNNEVIKFIEEITNKYFSTDDANEGRKSVGKLRNNDSSDNVNVKISIDDISYLKDKFKREYEYGKFYNNENYSIIHLDNVLNEYFEILIQVASDNDSGITKKTFVKFIKINLDSNYGS